MHLLTVADALACRPLALTAALAAHDLGGPALAPDVYRVADARRRVVVAVALRQAGAAIMAHHALRRILHDLPGPLAGRPALH